MYSTTGRPLSLRGRGYRSCSYLGKCYTYAYSEPYSQAAGLCPCLYPILLPPLLPLQRRRLDWRKRHCYSGFILQCNPQSSVPVTATPRTGTHCQRHRYSTRYSAEIVKQPGIRTALAYAWFLFYQSMTSSTMARCSVEVLRR